jgi:hypothetical protein
MTHDLRKRRLRNIAENAILGLRDEGYLTQEALKEIIALLDTRLEDRK